MNMYYLFASLGIILTSLGIILTFLKFSHQSLTYGNTLSNFVKKLDKLKQKIEAYHFMIGIFSRKLHLVFGASHGFHAFSICLLLAFIYPIVFFMLGWVVSGNNEFSGYAIFPQYELMWFRLGFCFLFE